MTHFASKEMLGEAQRCCHEVRFETRASKFVCSPALDHVALGELAVLPRSRSCIWGGKWGRQMEKGYERERSVKETKGKGEPDGRGWNGI